MGNQMNIQFLWVRYGACLQRNPTSLRESKAYYFVNVSYATTIETVTLY